MRVAISAGGRFHAFDLAHQLQKRKSLVKLYTFSYSRKNYHHVSSHLVKNIIPCRIIDLTYNKLRLGGIIPSRIINFCQDNMFDYYVGNALTSINHLDIFVGWAHYFLHSLAKIKKTGAKIILESGSSHILFQQKLLKEEYKKFGLTAPPIHPKIIEKMLAEYQAADYIMTLSEFSRQSFIQQGINPQKILMGPLGCSNKFFATKSKTNSPVFRAIFVGMLSIRKGILYLLEAWHKAQLPEKKSELILVGFLQNEIKQILPKQLIKKNIVFYGPVTKNHLKELYHSSSIFILPSIEDGFGMAASEAMASSLPVILTDGCGISELIKDGEEGFIVPSRNSQALAEKISWLYHHQQDAKVMGEKGYLTIKKHSWDNYGEQVYTTYQKILAHQP